jgi:hypothetical protein
LKYLEFAALLEGDAANIACLSTYQFDPDFFERRLMRCPMLAKARRIIVFLDARQWLQRLRHDLLARGLNRRYLVVPVWRSAGVFHPKLSLLLTDTGGRVLCGSNNLTRSGCSSNLEILNAVPFDQEGKDSEARDLAREAFEFFVRAAKDTDAEVARIAGKWLKEVRDTYPWLAEPIEAAPEKRQLRLMHTYDGSIWERLVENLSGDKPREFMVISPFHDSDAGACRRLARQWPGAKIELVVQQGYTNLAVASLKKIKTIRLAELRGVTRRAHAKIIAWRSKAGAGCLVGSANFTSAALDGRNVEASLFITDAEDALEALFDGHLSRRAISLTDFEPGSAEEPSADGELPPLRIDSAVLTESSELVVSYAHDPAVAPTGLRVTLRTPGESRPRVSLALGARARSPVAVALPDGALLDAHGTLLATLVGDVGGSTVESPPSWVIQEARLTYEPSESSTSPKGRIEESGEGLPEYLDELGKQAGQAAVVEYLSHLNIRFDDGGGSRHGQRRFRLKMRDPFRFDNPPDWLINSRAESDDLELAVYEFVERHEHQRLLRHAHRGNVNGMENFLDIFTTSIRLLYVYFRRGVVKKGQILDRGCRLIRIAMAGHEDEDESLDGYLKAIHSNLQGDRVQLQEACNEANYLAEVRAALLILQSVRFIPGEVPRNGPTPRGPGDVLPSQAHRVSDAIAGCGLREPPSADVQRALEGYRMLTEEEARGLVRELPRSAAARCAGD